MSYEIKGKLIFKGDIIDVSDKFRKREFVVETSENSNGQTFTEKVKLQLTQKNCGVIDSISVGDNINTHFNIKGSEWSKGGKTSYFTNLDAWKVDKIDENGDISESPIRVDPLAGKIEVGTENDFFDDDLPF